MVMAIVAILAAIGVPSFKYVTASNRIASEINGLLGDMQFARSEAVKQGQSVTVCVSTNGTSCTGGSDVAERLDRVLGPERQQVAWTRVKRSCAFSRRSAAPTPSSRASTPSRRSPTTAWAMRRPAFAANITINLHDSTNTTAWTRCLQITPIGTPTTEKYGAGTPPCT